VTRYELLDRIGVGGMAEIFRGKAVAAGGFEKPVAIKRILPHLSQDKRFVELLIAEAKVLSLLKHRNIVQIFDVGLGDDSQYFLVMEFVDGKDLGAIQRGLELARRRLPFDLALHIGAEICEALEHAHTARAPDGKSMSLVHRDVSPSNVLVSRAGELKLTDFGIAKRAEQEATGHGAVRGKFAYISPEQARNEHLDPRSDVFAVGILLWELVTGRRLFSGLGDLEALRAVREAKVPRPRELDSRLGADVDALIMSTLAPEPRGRPTAGQLSARLRSLRYALEVTVGDPASELAKTIDLAEAALRDSAPAPAVTSARVELGGDEATVIRIHTADAFSMRDLDGTGLAAARQVIDKFDEDETRQAMLSRDQLAFLRDTAGRDSGELTSAVEPPLPGLGARRLSDEHTRARPPIMTEDAPTFPPANAPTFLPDSGPFEIDEATRLVDRTPPPELGDEPSERDELPSRRGEIHARRRDEPDELPGHPRRRDEPDELPGHPRRRDEPDELPGHPRRRDEPDELPGHPRRRDEPDELPSHARRQPRLATQPPPMPAGSRRAPTSEPHGPPPGTVQERRPIPPTPGSALAHPAPPSLPPPVPLPPTPNPGGAGMPPQLAAMPPQLPPAPSPMAGYAPWMPSPPPRAIPGSQSRAPSIPGSQHRPPSNASRASVTAMNRRRPLKTWVLVLGALFMALLAFAVTRACMRPAPPATSAPRP
jgi:serine/threonine protein kinase